MGLDIEIKVKGDGINFPKNGQTVKVHYVGTFQDGSVFDSSRSRNKPFEFVLGAGQVIRAWDEGIGKLSLGERAILVATSDYAYGEMGMPGVIPPNATLIFDVELISFE